MIENIFDSPIPGESLTKTPGNAAWENPPQYVNVNEAAEYIWEKLHEEKFLDQVVSFLANDVPIEAIARMILFGGFVEGKWTPDVAILLSEVVFKQIMAIGMNAGVKNMKMFLKDTSNNQFHKEFIQFKMEKDKLQKTPDDKKIKKFVEEVKKELEPSGLMKKETE
tara:strand:+ start:692 stop:1189 length:498 start_codon:yes stop_codon:yes gene_type:complete